MSQLTGKSTRTEITRLEIVSDDSKRVLAISKEGDKIKLIERDANDNPYGWENRIIYTLDAEQKKLVGIAILTTDAAYNLKELDKISITQFQIPQPEPEKEPIADCSPIAVADAQAAAALVAKEARIEAVQFEMRLDHTRDKHAYEHVEGCPLCVESVFAIRHDPNSDNTDLDDLPF
jgi:hypothetical protein